MCSSPRRWSCGDTLGPNAPPDAVEQVYPSCLHGRGYARDKPLEPPPADSHRGIESDEELAAVASRDEYATMRRRLVEGVTPGR